MHDMNIYDKLYLFLRATIPAMPIPPQSSASMLEGSGVTSTLTLSITKLPVLYRLRKWIKLAVLDVPAEAL